MNEEQIDNQKEQWNRSHRIRVSKITVAYVQECVALGVLKEGEKVSVAACATALGYSEADLLQYVGELMRDVCTPDYKVSGKDADYFLRFYFRQGIIDVFRNELDCEEIIRESIMPVKEKLVGYVVELYPLYREIMKTEVPHEQVAYMPFSARAYARNASAVSSFISAVASKRLRRGKNVYKYFANCGVLPESVKRLLKISKTGKYILANTDRNSTDFKLALISAFPTSTQKNNALLQMKIEKWRQLRRQ